MKGIKQWFRCFVLNEHEDGYPVPKVGGRDIQHCINCDQPIRQHPVGLSKAKEERYAKGARWRRL